jgi:WD40 repeat protein
LLDTETGAITRLFGRQIDSMDEFQERYVQLPGRGDMMNSVAVTSPDSHWLANTTANDEIIVRDIQTGDERTLRPPSEEPAQFNIRAMVFSLDSRELTYYDLGDDQFHVLDMLTGEEIRTYAHGWSQFALAPDGVTVAYADRETRAIYLADTTSTDEPTRLLDLPENLDVGPNITALAFTSDGKQLVVGGLFARDGKNQIYVFNLAG